MPRVVFTPHLRRHVECSDVSVAGGTVRDALAEVFRDNRQLEGYVVDERGRLRKHVVVFVDGKTLHDRVDLTDAVEPDGEIYVMQALSGG